MVVLCDEIHDTVEGDPADHDRLRVDIYIINQHRVEIIEHAVVCENHPVHHHQHVVSTSIS